MRDPVIVAVDDEPHVLAAVERDLRAHYAGRFRIVGATDPRQALEALEQLKLRDDPVALLLVDQRMPGLSGVELLAAARELHPEAKRALLTAYADTDAAIRAINDVALDHYLLKPWDPPEERLYPVLDDLLDDWSATFRPPFEGVRLVDTRWSAAAHQLRDFLGRNQVPYRWLDVESDEEAAQLRELAGEAQLPLVVLDDGRALAAPSASELAAALGMAQEAELPFYDLVIVGAGPAGLAAAVYGASEGLNTIMLEREAPGGQAGSSSRIENYLGFPSGLSGGDLARRGVTQARRLGAEILAPRQVEELRVKDGYKIVRFEDGTEVSGKALLLSMGVAYRRLEVPGIDALTGAGVYYGSANSAAATVRDSRVIIVGGANSAGQAAVHLSQHASQVTMLVRGASIEEAMSSYLVDRITSTPNIVVRTETAVSAVHGDGHLEGVTVTSGGSEEQLSADAMFIFIGAQPYTGWLPQQVARDRHGFVLTGPDLRDEHRRSWRRDREPYLLETNVAGVFAAGDVRAGSVKRVASAVGEGSVAVMFVHRYLAE